MRLSFFLRIFKSRIDVVLWTGVVCSGRKYNPCKGHFYVFIGEIFYDYDCFYFHSYCNQINGVKKIAINIYLLIIIIIITIITDDGTAPRWRVACIQWAPTTLIWSSVVLAGRPTFSFLSKNFLPQWPSVLRYVPCLLPLQLTKPLSYIRYFFSYADLFICDSIY